jgi:hypothetical protein
MFLRIGSFEFFIDRAPQYGCLEVDHVRHDAGNREVWAGGLHLVISKRARGVPPAWLTSD